MATALCPNSFSDFLVFEVSAKGKVIRLSDIKRPANDRPSDETDVAPKAVPRDQDPVSPNS